MRKTTLLVFAAAFITVLPGWAAGKKRARDDVRPLQRLREPAPGTRVVNGLTTTGYPSVVALVDPATGAEFCTGTWIGCETVLTAAHCVCASIGSDCQSGGPDLLDPASVVVFAQHAGFFPVSSLDVPVDYELGVAADVAVLKLAVVVDGVAPAAINTLMRPTVATPGEIVGFGRTRGDLADNGVKRYGQIVTSTCTSVPDANHVCWEFEDPLGPPGSDSNTCAGDSGGPLFIDFGSEPLVAGVASGGSSPSCLPSDAAFDTDVFVYRAWIEAAGGADLLSSTCGELPQAGSSEAPIAFGEGTLNGFTTSETWVLEVPTGTATLRVTLNGEDGTDNDFDLYVRSGAPPTFQDFDCASFRAGNPEFCEVLNPTPGRWYFLANRFSGAGFYQLTATTFTPDLLVFEDGFESGDTSAWSDEITP